MLFHCQPASHTTISLYRIRLYKLDDPSHSRGILRSPVSLYACFDLWSVATKCKQKLRFTRVMIWKYNISLDYKATWATGDDRSSYRWRLVPEESPAVEEPVFCIINALPEHFLLSPRRPAAEAIRHQVNPSVHACHHHHPEEVEPECVQEATPFNLWTMMDTRQRQTHRPSWSTYSTTFVLRQIQN